jgi:hypothetical protein
MGSSSTRCPMAAITVCRLVEGLYDAEEFRSDERVRSVVFPGRVVPADQVLSAGAAG